jgi:hypothetical protein
MKLSTVEEAVQWLRDTANGDPEHERSRFFLEAANDLEERGGGPRPLTAQELAGKYGFRPHTP